MISIKIGVKRNNEFTRNNLFFQRKFRLISRIKPLPNFFFITFSCSPYTISPGITIQNCTLSRAIIFGKKKSENNTETLMIVPLTKQEKKKNCFERTHNVSYEKKLLFEHNLLIETRAKDFSISGRSIIFFFYFRNGETRSRENRNRIYTCTSGDDVNVDRNLGSASSPINNYDIVAAAKRFNQCHRANFRSPLASSLLPLFLHHRLATPQEITIETQAEVAIYQFPGWTPRLNAGDRDSDFPGVDVA